MVKRNASADENEPEVSKFPLPSTNKEHLFQVTDVLEDIDEDPNIVHAKCEVVGGDEEGRSILQRCTLDDSIKQFYYTRMFLKAIAEQYKGQDFPIDTDNWIGKQFYAIVSHDKTGKYANVEEFFFDKQVEQPPHTGNPQQESATPETEGPVNPEDVAWDE